MSLRNPSIDMVVRLPNDPHRMALVIFDNEPIASPPERERLLHKKLMLCMEFVASGRIAAASPADASKQAIVEVVCDYPPTAHMLNIHALSDPQDKSVSLPVHVMSLADFKAQFGLAAS